MNTADPSLTLIIFTIFIVLLIAPTVIIWWKLYVKAGQKGWKFLIPFYSTYVMGVIAKRPTVGLVAAISNAAYSISSYFASTSGGNAAVLVSGLVYVIFGLAVLSLLIRQYDAGIGKWVLFLFIPIIGVFFVDSVRYKNDDSKEISATPADPNQSPIQSQRPAINVQTDTQLSVSSPAPAAAPQPPSNPVATSEPTDQNGPTPVA